MWTSGCSSARLEYTSGGRVVAGSNPVIPTFLSRPQILLRLFCCADAAVCKHPRIAQQNQRSALAAPANAMAGILKKVVAGLIV